MKKSFLAIAIIFSAGVAKAGDIKVHVNGMVCAFCAQGITKKFKARDEIAKVDVNLSDKLVSLALKDKKDLSDQVIGEILRDSGYSVEKIERN